MLPAFKGQAVCCILLGSCVLPMYESRSTRKTSHWEREEDNPTDPTYWLLLRMLFYSQRHEDRFKN